MPTRWRPLGLERRRTGAAVEYVPRPRSRVLAAAESDARGVTHACHVRCGVLAPRDRMCMRVYRNFLCAALNFSQHAPLHTTNVVTAPRRPQRPYWSPASPMLNYRSSERSRDMCAPRGQVASYTASFNVKLVSVDTADKFVLTRYPVV